MSFSNGLEKRPRLRFPGFDEPLAKFEIGNACEQLKETIDPRTTPTEFYAEYSMPAFDNNRKVAKVQGKDMNSARKVMSKPCVLINKLNVRKKRIWLVDHPEKNAVSSTEFVPLSSTMMSLGYLNYVALTDRFTNYMLNCSSGSSNSQKRVTPDDILDYVITAPSLLEQERIARFLETIDSKIRAQEDLIELLKKYKRGLISNILKQNLAVSHEGEKWEEVSLNDVADGFKYGMNAAATTFDGIHKYVRITDIDDDTHTYIDDDPVSPSGALEEKYRVRDNDILFARTGASVGKSYLYRKSDGELFFAGFLIRVHVKEGVDSEYVFLNTLTEEYDKWVLLESARSGQPGINAEQYRQYRFKLPSLRTQRKIAAIAQKLDARIQKESMCLHFFQEQKLGLLQQLFI